MSYKIKKKQVTKFGALVHSLQYYTVYSIRLKTNTAVYKPNVPNIIFIHNYRSFSRFLNEFLIRTYLPITACCNTVRHYNNIHNIACTY